LQRPNVGRHASEQVLPSRRVALKEHFPHRASGWSCDSALHWFGGIGGREIHPLGLSYQIDLGLRHSGCDTQQQHYTGWTGQPDHFPDNVVYGCFPRGKHCPFNLVLVFDHTYMLLSDLCRNLRRYLHAVMILGWSVGLVIDRRYNERGRTHRLYLLTNQYGSRRTNVVYRRSVIGGSQAWHLSVLSLQHVEDPAI
jgi:hypothetical protein